MLRRDLSTEGVTRQGNRSTAWILRRTTRYDALVARNRVRRPGAVRAGTALEYLA